MKKLISTPLRVLCLAILFTSGLMIPTYRTYVYDAVDILPSVQAQEASRGAISPVEALKAHYPQLYAIAFCESGLRQFDSNGSILQGRVDSADIGFLQINLDAHKKELQSMGLNPAILEDNIKFGIWLYQKEGVRPWEASKKCWQA